MDPIYDDPYTLTFTIERHLLRWLDLYRKRHLVEMKTGRKSRRYPKIPKGYRPMTRSEVLAEALTDHMGEDPSVARRAILVEMIELNSVRWLFERKFLVTPEEYADTYWSEVDFFSRVIEELGLDEKEPDFYIYPEGGEDL